MIMKERGSFSKESESKSNSPRWHQVYYLLAAFDILAISFSIYLNHLIMNEFTHSIEINRQWSERLGAFTELGIRATELNAPGNDVFNTGDIDNERRLLDLHLEETLVSFEQAQLLSENTSTIEIPLSIPSLLQRYRQDISNLHNQARQVFDALDKGDNQTAGEHMAQMDSHFGEAFVRVAQLQTIANNEQTRLLEIDQQRATYFQRYEVLIAGCIAFMVIAVTIYGHFLAQRLRLDQAIKRNLFEKSRHNESIIQQQLQQLEETSQAKDDFLANVSHEIRTPMNGIIGAAELMKDADNDKQRTEYTRVIQQSASALLSLINDLLDLSKIESGQLEVSKESFQPSSILNEVNHLLREKSEKKSIELSFVFDEEQRTGLIGDSSRIRQILINLVGNAIKFTEQGSVTIETTVVKIDELYSLLEITVEDTGIGIEERHQEKLFSRFTQADGSITRKFGGTGLGLSISKQLADLMGGELTFTSEYGKGSTFKLSLKLPKSIHAVPSREVEIERNYGLHALLVEDNTVNQMVIAGLLQKVGISVEIAEDGVIGLARYNEKVFDLVFMDMQMPNMDGITATRHIRALARPKSNVLIIAMTANAGNKDKQRCFEAGMSDFVSKPVQKRVLIETLDRVLLSSPAAEVNYKPSTH
ncbi:MAG: hypothetical protein CL693_06185 [Cellvibrionaceae bacterium]|nr:hypothetical protein [Cellvibrionaceae bacterium]|tara:strand:+ start:1293 stop:3233 length:1941 start_codon:yes stop_codon:yes gene_type:complete